VQSMRDADSALKRQLGLAAVVAVVSGNILGSGIFFVPGELAKIAIAPWQIYFLWALSGLIVLCGALTLAELSANLPRSGATYHIIREAFGPFWGFLKIWVELWISGPASIAGVAILFGEFLSRLFSGTWGSPVFWGALAILFFTAINLAGVRWGGLTQVLVTTIKVCALILLIGGCFLFIKPAANMEGLNHSAGAGILSFIRLIGMGIAAVLFTYDGWIDVTHTSGEVINPRKNLPLGLSIGVLLIIALYLLVNAAYLRAMPLAEMRRSPDLVATAAAVKAFGSQGSKYLTALIAVSMFGALGGLIMTLPRLYFAAAFQYKEERGSNFFRLLSAVQPKTSVPIGSILFCAVLSLFALLFFQSFSRLVAFLVVPLQAVNMLMVAAIFRFRRKSGSDASAYRTPGYPLTPLIFIIVIALFLISTIYYQPIDSFIGLALTATGAPVYFWMTGK
jgi:basic amino acid/polyamine antiporter, APA family